MRGGLAETGRLMRVVVLVAIVFVVGQRYLGFVEVAWAQDGGGGTDKYVSDSKNQLVRNFMRSAVNRNINQVGRSGSEYAPGQKFNLPPLPGEQGGLESGEESKVVEFLIEKGKIPDYGKNNRSSVNVVLPPLRAFQQISESADIKDMFKAMVVAKVPVLFQTYMMVENGAATGYIGGLNAASNVLANTMQTQDFQLKLLELTDDTGKMKEAFIQKLRKEGAKTQSWPAALYAAVGDSTDFNTVKGDKLEIKSDAKAYDLKGLPVKDGEGDGAKRLLSDLLFLDTETQRASTQEQKHSNEDLETLKNEFKRLVGDVEIELAPATDTKGPPDGWLRVVNTNFIAPPAEGQRRGVALENWKEVQVAWENINSILADRCKFPNEARNENKEPQKKIVAATWKELGKAQGRDRDPWELASSPDIPLTMSAVEQLFNLVKKTGFTGGNDCEKLRLKYTDIPTQRDTEEEQNLNDCEDSKSCFRNRLILHMAFMIARSRTLHTYKTMYIVAKRFATDPALDQLVDRQFLRVLSNMNIEHELQRNRTSWEELSGFLASYVQGDSSAGAHLRPEQASSSSPSSASTGGKTR